MMTSARRKRPLDAQHLALELERPERRITNRIVDAIIVPRPVAARIHEVPLAFALEHDRPLDIALGRNVAPHRAVLERHERLEVLGEFHEVASSPSAIHHVPRPFVFKHVLVYRLGAIPKPVDERLADEVAIRAFGLVRHGDADAAVAMQFRFGLR